MRFQVSARVTFGNEKCRSLDCCDEQLATNAVHYTQLASDIHIGVDDVQLTFDVTRKSLRADDPEVRRDPAVHAPALGITVFVIADGAGTSGKLAFVRVNDGLIRFGAHLAARQ